MTQDRGPAARIARLPKAALSAAHPTRAQRAWLARGLARPGGKLPLFDRDGQRISQRTVRACLEHGWAEPSCTNPTKTDWGVCRLTRAGRRALAPGALHG